MTTAPPPPPPSAPPPAAPPPAAPPPAAPPPAVPPGAPWPPGPATYQRTNGLAVASMVLGIVSLFCLGVLLIPPLLAVIFGHVAVDQIARSAGTQKGRGLAITGLVLGWILLVPVAILALVWLGYGISNL